MEKIVKERRFFYILTLILLAGFLYFPSFCLADDFENIDLKDIDKYLELPQKDARQLIDSLRQVFTTEKINLWGSGYSTDEEIAVTEILLKVIKGEFINYLFRDAPIEITLGIIKGTIDIVRIYIDPSVGFEKLEKESVQRAIDYGMKVLLGEDIRVTPGAIKFKYVSNYGSEKEVIFQYIIIYKQLDSKSGETEIRFYSPISIEAPKSLAKGALNLQSDLPPFIVDIKGVVEKTQFDTFQWTEGPSININFPSEVPDLGIKLLSFWEKQILKPIETTIKEVEIIITKITGKSLGLVDIWNEIKSFISKIKSFSPAGLVETSTGGLENISNILNLQTEKLSPDNLIEVQPQSDEKEIKQEQEQEPDQELTLEEMQEILDDIAERIDILNQQVAELVEVRLQQTEKETKKIEEIDEAEEIEEVEEIEELEESELAEETAQVDKTVLCEKVGQPSPNKVIFNEIAWMGRINSANDEWIELKNISGSPINLSGWQLLDKDNQIKVIFDTGNSPIISNNVLFLLERTDDDSVPNITADLIYTGILNNTNEVFYIFDENCRLQDEVSANPNWPAGDNSSKRTMERKYDLGWQTSFNPGGTPKAENSSGYIIQSIAGGGGGGGGGGGSVSTPPQQTPAPSPTSSLPQILITEVQIASISSNNDEFIELYNPNNQEVDISSWSIQKSHSTSTVVYKKNFETGNKIPAKGYFLIVYASSTDQNLLNLADFTHKTFNLAPDNTIYLVANQEKIENASDTDIINMVGFGENVFSEGNPAPEPQDGESIGRKWSSTTQNYINTDNNQIDFEIQSPTPKAQNQSPQLTENQLPIAQFIYSPANPIVNQEIFFNSSSSTDPDGTITSYIWDFGDTTTSTEIKATTTHNYSTSSNFLVNLTVVDNNNATSSATTTITIFTPETPTLEVVINEIQIDSIVGAGGADDDWVELYNPTTQDISLAWWSIQEHSATSSCSIDVGFYKKNFPAGTIIPANSYFLIVDTEANENLKMIADFTIGWSLTQGNTIYLVNNEEKIESGEDSNIVDKVGFGQACFPEIEAAPNPPEGKSIERKELGLDTDDNSQDFVINENPSPTNSKGEAGPTFLTNYQISEDTTFTLQGSPYIIGNTLYVLEGKILTINSEVTLRFEENAGLEVQGTLKAIGQENNKIIFTSSDEPNYWNGIYFTASSTNSELNWTEIKYGRRCLGWGCGKPSAILVENSSIIFKNSILENYTDRGLRLVNSSSVIERVNFIGSGINVSTVGIEIEGGSPIIKDCDLIQNNKHGIFIDFLAEGDLPIIEGNNFEGNEKAIYALNPNVIFRNNRGINNQIDGILIFFNVSQNLTWFKNELPYIIGEPPLIGGFVGVDLDRTLTIEPGVRVEFGNGATLEVNGTLLAQGTVSKPIIFTAYPGGITYGPQAPWRGIYFTASSTNSVLDNVILSYGGYDPQGNRGSVYVKGTSIEFKNSTSTNSYEAGIYLENSSSTISNSYFANNKFGIKIYGSEYPQLLEGISFTSNTAPYYSDIFIDNINQCHSCLPEYLATSTNNNCP